MKLPDSEGICDDIAFDPPVITYQPAFRRIGGQAMTVSVTCSDGTVDEYRRYGDMYLKHQDGSLDVIRTGAKKPFNYKSGQWTDVEGDQRKHKLRGFWH